MNSIYDLIENMPDAVDEIEPIEGQPDPEPTAPEPTEPPIDYGVLGSDWAPPSQFDSTDNELDWYRSNYGKIVTSLNSEDFRDKLLENYQNLLAKESGESDEFIQHYKGFKTNPKEYIRQYFPDKMAELGIEPVMSEDEIQFRIDETMKEEFGELYENLLSPLDAAKPKSFTYKALKRQEALLKEYEGRNAESIAKYKEYAGTIKQQEQAVPQQVDENAIIEEQYNLYFKQWKRDDYNNFIEKAKNKQWNLQDMEKVINFDTYLQRAKEEGRKTALQSISKQSNGVTISPSKNETTTTREGVARKKEPSSIYELMMEK